MAVAAPIESKLPRDRTRRRGRPAPSAAAVVLLAGALLLPTASHALYKVIGPDGKVTYTDRPPATARGDRVTPLSANGAVPAAVPLPLELRQASARYPVTLYVSANCDPCDAGRLLLRQRGIPYGERQILTVEDSEALLRLSGARTAPTLMIGAQLLKGLAPEVWHSYLDSAGYPRESRLPSNYAFEPASPLTQRRDAATPAAPAAVDRSTTVTPAEPRDAGEAPRVPIRF